MSCLATQGRVDSIRCFASEAPVEFDLTKRVSLDGYWRVTPNLPVWGKIEFEGEIDIIAIQ